MEVIQNKLMHSDFEPFPSSREKKLSRSLTALGLQFLTFIISKTEAKDQDFSWCTSLLLGLVTVVGPVDSLPLNRGMIGF